MSFGSKFDMVLHDFVVMGIFAASIFVKNPAHQETAGKIIQAVTQLLPALDAQLNPGNPTTLPTAPVPAPAAPVPSA